ncbi:hypothetical protein HAX54_052754, partial [Datura stramonium]|nr:hypothetical protein [Datura stramonium]
AGAYPALRHAAWQQQCRHGRRDMKAYLDVIRRRRRHTSSMSVQHGTSYAVVGRVMHKRPKWPRIGSPTSTRKRDIKSSEIQQEQ